jgi:hypothetical protein
MLASSMSQAIGHIFQEPVLLSTLDEDNHISDITLPILVINTFKTIKYICMITIDIYFLTRSTLIF